MTREYRTSPTMFIDRFSNNVYQPDKTLITYLHAHLDLLPEENALAIDYIVAQLLALHRPDRQHKDILIPPSAEKEQPNG